MEGTRGHLLGVGPLTASRVVSDALAMLGQSFWRISGVAIIFFALPAVVVIVAETAVEGVSADQGTLGLIVAFSAVAVAVSLRVLGPVAFAGFLDEAVAKEYQHGTRHRLSAVLAELPWKKLIVADVIVVIVVEIGLNAFVVPGLIAFGGLGMVGPVIVQEDDSVRASFRRTLYLAAHALSLVALLVAAPFAFEQIVHGLAYVTLHAYGIGVELVAEWILAIILGGTLGLLEVALASELMVRNPRSARGNARGELVDDGERATVSAAER